MTQVHKVIPKNMMTAFVRPLTHRVVGEVQAAHSAIVQLTRAGIPAKGDWVDARLGPARPGAAHV